VRHRSRCPQPTRSPEEGARDRPPQALEKGGGPASSWLCFGCARLVALSSRRFPETAGSNERVDSPPNLRDRGYWERQCASKKHGDVCNLLGANYERGGDTPWGFFPQDYQLAARAYSRGCEQGDMDSCGSAARLMILGKPVRDLDRGARLARSTCERGHADSCGLAGMIGAIEARTLVAYQGGLELLNRGCSQGGLNACNYLKGFRTNQLSDRSPPSDAYGLPFSAQPAHAAKWCESHGYGVEQSGNDLRCRNSGGFAEYVFRFNGQTLDAVLASPTAGPDADAWVTAFKETVGKMRNAYGTPTSLDDTVPGRPVAGGTPRRSKAEQRNMSATWKKEIAAARENSRDFSGGAGTLNPASLIGHSATTPSNGAVTHLRKAPKTFSGSPAAGEVFATGLDGGC
jgi:hypothetical protein